MMFKRNISLIRLLFSVFISLILCLGMVNAATISGTIYDLALQQEYDVVLEIDTVPRQLTVSKDGTYTFNVNPGNYTLHAYTSTSESSEPILVADDGTYVLDIVLEDKVLDLLDDVLPIDSGIDVSSSDTDGAKKIGTIPLLVLVGVVLLAISLSLYALSAKLRKKVSKRSDEQIPLPKQESAKVVDEYESTILSIIKKEKRTTQKDIRKEIPLSEAKVSLILTDLEDKGNIRKIKKGRGNVLIFVKD